MKHSKKFNRFMAVTATAALTATAIAPTAQAKVFPDTKGNEFESFIDVLSDMEIIKGQANGKFNPSGNVTRGQVAIMLGRWLEKNGYKAPSNWNEIKRFKDVNQLATSISGAELALYSALVKDLGVFSGSNGYLKPTEPINRQNMSKVLNNAYKVVYGMDLVTISKTKKQVRVKDLNTAFSENRGYIQAMANLGITTVTNYRPKETVKRGQFSKFLYLTSDVQPVLKISKVTAVGETMIRVEFVNGHPQNIVVKKLKKNVPTKVTFKINGVQHSATVTYK